MQEDYYKYNEKHFSCSHWGWMGKGSMLINGDFSEVHLIGDLNCP